MGKRFFFLAFLTFTLFILKGQTEQPSQAPGATTESIQPISTDDVTDSLQRPAWKDYWKFSGVFAFKAAQTQFVNWAAGGQSNFNTIFGSLLSLKYTKKKLAWESTLDVEFGAMYSSDFERYEVRKSSDKLNFSSKFGYEVANMWFITALGTFKSQFYRGYSYGKVNNIETRKLNSNILSPSFTEISIGVDWKWKDIFSIYVSPVAGLVTTCLDEDLRESFSVPLDKTYKTSLGLTIRGTVTYDKIKNLKLMSAIQLFTPYTDTKQKFGNFNVDWDFMISYQFVKVLSVSLSTSLKYYEEIMIEKDGVSAPRVQFMENFAFGIGYSF